MTTGVNTTGSLLDDDPLLAQPRQVAPTQSGPPPFRDFGDHRMTRQFIYEDVLDAANHLDPVTDDRHTLALTNVRYADPEKFTRRQQKQAILAGETLGRRMKGTWELRDNASGKVLDAREQVVARVPFLTHRGTFIHRGNEYTVNHQQRLLPGVFTRRMANGQLESHVNILPGKGLSHRYFLDPEKSTFKLKVGQAEMPLLPLLRVMGATDEQLREAWGGKILASNYKHDDPSVIKKLAQRIIRRKEQSDDEGTTRQRLRAAFEAMETDEKVTGRTLGRPHKNLTLDAMLDTTRKLLAVSRGESEVDDRDHLAYQTFLGPEDFFTERLRRDHSKVRKMLLRKAAAAGNLSKIPAGALTGQLEQAILGSGLGQALEEINPLEIFDKQSRVSRLGEGGIPSTESVPDEARSVSPSHMGFIDPLRTPESAAVGIDLNMARNARKGRDGRLYARFNDARTGKEVWRSPQDVADMSIAFPGALKSESKRVPAMRGGKITYVNKKDVDLVLPHFEDAFSPLGNLVPLKSMVKGQRVAMASRMLTQALALKDGQAPLVQGAMPGRKDWSFEDEYGKQMGAVRADKDGRVMSVKDGVMHVKFADGTTDDIEMYENFPFNRKSLIHQTALMQPGQTFKAGQTLVRSNFTDEAGAAAPGVNARVAYMPWKGYNFEDALVISESMSKRLTSEHAYQHDLEVDDRTRTGKKNYLSLFPQRFDKKTLAALDDDGIVKPGATVEYGQPLILAARQKEHSAGKIHKRKQQGFTDNAVLWKHHDPGIVTDVVRGKKGPVVLVRSLNQMQVGDKMSGRYGDKGVVADIVPDHQMPYGADGRPFEVLLNPLGVISRTNPAQMVEAMLGKIAERTGKPIKVPDFEDVEDMTAWAQDMLRRHEMRDTEDVVLPELGTKVGGVAAGNRFFMKLHHTSEGKAQGRSGGSYSSDETPAKGGESGCFIYDTPVKVLLDGREMTVPLGWIVTNRHQLPIRSATSYGYPCWATVSDHFEYEVPAERLVEIELANGKVLVVTTNHVLYMADGTTKLAGLVRPDDDLMEV